MQVMAVDLGRFDERFRTGQGFGWHERSPGHWDAMARITEASVLPFLPAWLAAMPETARRLTDGGKVADVGCGYGARARRARRPLPGRPDAGVRLPRRVDRAGSDEQRGLPGSATGCGSRWPPRRTTSGSDYDLITFFDSLHDLGDPVGALAHARAALAPDGAVLLIEPGGADRLEDNINPVGRLWYGVSTTVCTPNGLAQEGHPLGTVAGEGRLRETAMAAGFSRIRRLGVDAPINILLELRP